MEYFNLEMDLSLGSVDDRTLLLKYAARQQMKAMDNIFLLVTCDLKLIVYFGSYIQSKTVSF